jgi:hypothetical protein
VNRVGEDVDKGLLLRFTKDQGLWVGEEGDLVNLVALNNDVLRFGVKQLEVEEGEGYLYPLPKCSCCCYGGIIWVQWGQNPPNNPPPYLGLARSSP